MSRSRNYSFVVLAPTSNDLSILSNLACKYLVFRYGVDESEPPHYTGTVCFKTPKTFSAVWKLLPRAHIAPTFDLDGSIRYCKKGGAYTERGISPCLVLDADTMNNIDDRFFWYYGPSRSANSCKAREENPGAYIKLPVEHWYNYSGQDVVIIEDWHPGLHGLLCNLKQWADHYPFPAEIKEGELTKIRPKKIIITSEYRIDECFLCDIDRECVHRRFKEVYID